MILITGLPVGQCAARVWQVRFKPEDLEARSASAIQAIQQTKIMKL